MVTRGYVPEVIEAVDGLEVDPTRASGTVRLQGTGGVAITPFRFIPLGAAMTSSAAFVNLLVVTPDVTVTKDGNILLDFDASLELTPPLGTTGTQGAAVQFLWDGAPLTQFAFFELDAAAIGTAFDTFAMAVRLRALVAATVGTHTLAVQWLVIDAASNVVAFPGNGSLTIQGV